MRSSRTSRSRSRCVRHELPARSGPCPLGRGGQPHRKGRMTRPRVTIHNTASVDGKVTGFPVDLGLYYEIAGRVLHDAVLTGSGTLLAAAAAQGIDLTGEDREFGA